MFKNGKLKKFKIAKGALILAIILTVICAIIYGFIVYFLNSTEELKNHTGLMTAKDIFLVLISICGTNLLISVIVDVNSKNKIISQFFNEDIITSPDFYKRIDLTEREKILDTLQLMDRCNNNVIIHKMYNSIQEKMNSYLTGNYYFQSCEYVVHASDKGQYYEKDTLRTMKLKSYKEKFTLKKYKLAEINIGEIDGKPSVEIKKVSIGNDEIDLKKDVEKVIVENDDSLEIKNGYTKTVKFFLKKDLQLSNKRATRVVINTVSRCSSDDKVASFRTALPCKNFSVSYSVEPSTNYKVVAHAFGFHDSARSYPNSSYENEVKVGFSDWIFTDDGVCITMIKK